MIANYTAFANKKDVEKEIKIQEQILSNEPNQERKAGLALNLRGCWPHAAIICG